MNASTALRILRCQQLMAAYYEPGRQDRNKTYVYRTKVLPLLGISRRTFSRYVGTPEAEVRRALQPKADPWGGRTLFDVCP